MVHRFSADQRAIISVHISGYDSLPRWAIYSCPGIRQRRIVTMPFRCVTVGTESIGSLEMTAARGAACKPFALLLVAMNGHADGEASGVASLVGGAEVLIWDLAGKGAEIRRPSGPRHARSQEEKERSRIGRNDLPAKTTAAESWG